MSCASILRSTIHTQPGNENDAKEIGYFLDILDLNKFDVFGDHINKARQERLRLPTRTPDEEDWLRLRKYTVECINSLSDIYTHIGLHEFVQLRNALCSRITLFNARRGGEPSTLTVLKPRLYVWLVC